MIREALWQEIHRLFAVERWSKSAIAQTLDVDRKTVRTCLAQPVWTPYERAAMTDTLLSTHRAFLEQRAPAVGHSAQVLYQELTQQHGYTGSYQTVKRFVRPLREAEELAARATVRFETPPGPQTQIDWGQATVAFRSGRAIRHFFILTLGYSRRGFYLACRDEQLPTFLDAHERAFDHFGATPRSTCMIAHGPSAGRAGTASSGTPPSKPSRSTGALMPGSVGPIAPKRRARSSRG